MNPDKFLTDLAALTGCESVDVSFRGFCHDNEKFSVNLFREDKAQPHGGLVAQGTGPTVEAAMQEARAKLAKHYA